MTENTIDMLKIEGNLSGEDLIKKKLVEEAPYQTVQKCIR
jgi:hypothetical protein